MARERTPEGKRVVIPVRVSEPKAAAIDKARGETPRSVWVEAAIDERLERLGQAEYEHQMAAARRLESRDRTGCPHPKARINKGLCGACGTYVGTKEGSRR